MSLDAWCTHRYQTASSKAGKCPHYIKKNDIAGNSTPETSEHEGSSRDKEA
jgi:hypothetical protein